jgi:hypothetical protein
VQGRVSIIGVLITPNSSYMTNRTLTLRAEVDVGMHGNVVTFLSPNDISQTAEYGRWVSERCSVLLTPHIVAVLHRSSYRDGFVLSATKLMQLATQSTRRNPMYCFARRTCHRPSDLLVGSRRACYFQLPRC